MKRLMKVLSLILAVAMVISLAACGKTDTASDNKAADSETVTVTDHAGNKVTVKKGAERIVVCDIYPLVSVLSVFFDSAEKIVGMAAPSKTAAENGLLSELYPEILDAETDFIDGTNVNIEELLTLEPDVVFYSAGSTQLGEQLRNAGLSAIGISAGKWQYDAIETLNNWIALLSQIYPENDRVAKVEDYSDKIYEKVQDRVKDLKDEERESVFFLFQYGESNITTSGKLFFGQWWADAIGAVNVGEVLDTDNSTAVNMEQIYQWDPQHILITNFNSALPEDLYNNTVGNFDWSAVSAVKNKKVSKMPLGMYRSYTCGVDTPVTLLWLASTVYPELFSDIDITEETKNYYKDVFDIELTDDQAKKIFAPTSAASAF